MNINKNIAKIKDILNHIHSISVQHSNHIGDKPISELYKRHIDKIDNLLDKIKKECEQINIYGKDY